MVPVPLFREDRNAAAATPQKLFKVNKDSHLIRKQTSPNNSGSNKPPPHNRQQNLHPPVIIYTHSPKVIHTQPQDFMALVQKLTGATPSSDEQTQIQQQQKTKLAVPDPRLSKPTTMSSDYNLDEYENKKSVMTALISNNFNTKVTIDDHSNDNNSSNNTDDSCNGGGGGSPGFFPPPIFDPRLVGPSASFPCFSPSFEDFYCPTNDSITTNLMSHHNFFNNQISSSSGSGASFIYYNDASSSFDAKSGMYMSSSSSSM